MPADDASGGAARRRARAPSSTTGRRTAPRRPSHGPRRGRRPRAAARRSATVAALASSGDAVLALCADALRRRELVERAARAGAVRRRRASRSPPARLADDGRRARWRAVDRRRRGVVARRLGGAGPRCPRWPPASSTWCVDRPAAVRASRARLRPAAGERLPAPRLGRRPRSSSRCASTTSEWPRAPSLAALYRALAAIPTRASLAGEPARCSAAPARHPRSPEVAARVAARARASSGVVAGSGPAPHRGPRRRILGGDGSRAIRGLRRLPRPLRGGQAIPERGKTTELDGRERARTSERRRPAPARPVAVTRGSAPAAAHGHPRRRVNDGAPRS